MPSAFMEDLIFSNAGAPTTNSSTDSVNAILPGRIGDMARGGRERRDHRMFGHRNAQSIVGTTEARLRRGEATPPENQDRIQLRPARASQSAHGNQNARTERARHNGLFQLQPALGHVDFVKEARA